MGLIDIIKNLIKTKLSLKVNLAKLDELNKFKDLIKFLMGVKDSIKVNLQGLKD